MRIKGIAIKFILKRNIFAIGLGIVLKKRFLILFHFAVGHDVLAGYFRKKGRFFHLNYPQIQSDLGNELKGINIVIPDKKDI